VGSVDVAFLIVAKDSKTRPSLHAGVRLQGVGCLGFRGLPLFVSEILEGQGGMQNRQPRHSYGHIRGGEP